MHQHGRFLALTLCLTFALTARAQESDAPKVEVGVQFTSLSVRSPDNFGTQNEPGFGGRVTYNFNDYFAVEAEGNFFPGADVDSSFGGNLSTGGSIQQLQAGVKVGKRFNRFGVFAKARPGFVSHSRTFHIGETADGGVEFGDQRKTHFSMDVGGVLEFYPSRRLMVRFDFGDTIVRYGERPFFIFPGGVLNAPAEFTHQFQFSGGVGWRFGGGSGPEEDASSDDRFDGERRFEVGAQFSALVLRIPRPLAVLPNVGPTQEVTSTETGFGARFGYNLTDHVAVEAEGNFYPRRTLPSPFNTATGGYPAQLQAGVKAGKRFRRFGVFGKARPGFVTFSAVQQLVGTDTITFGGFPFTVGLFEPERQTNFSLDLGGVLEFYHSRRLFTRFDFGDTLIRYPERQRQGFTILSIPFFTEPAETQHNFQFTAGLGFRF